MGVGTTRVVGVGDAPAPRKVGVGDIRASTVADGVLDGNGRVGVALTCIGVGGCGVGEPIGGGGVGGLGG